MNSLDSKSRGYNMDQRYCILTMPISKRGVTPLSNLVNIFEEISDEIYLVTGGEGYELLRTNEKIHVIEINHYKNFNSISRIISYIIVQLKMSWLLFKLRKNYNSAILFIGGEGLVLPSLTLRLLRKDSIIVLAGFPSKISQIKKDPLSKMTGYLSDVVLKLSDRIIVYSKLIIDERKLKQYGKKLCIAHRHYVDSKHFKCKKPIHQRENLIGYIGALNEIKGLKCFSRAIPMLLENDNKLKFMFIGDGPLKSEIMEYINQKDLNGKIILKGWVAHDELPYYLNKFKLLVLPSYTEGLPNVVIEAMACGTPVLTTAVGAIPDIVRDGYNGFIMEDNSPTSIKRNVLRAMKHPEIDKIILNAQITIDDHFNQKSVLKRWKKILE